MSLNNNLLAAAIVATGAAFATLPANAAVISLGYQRSQDTTITTFATATDGTAIGTATPGTYSITANAQGEPIVASPNLFSNAISVRNSGVNANANTLKVFVTETSVEKVTPFFSINFVDSSLSTLPVVESVYVSASNQAYALTTLVATNNTAIGANPTVLAATPAGLTGPYSITFVYSIDFPAGASIVNANINEIGVPGSVPEPMSLSLLGASLVGAGFIRRRSRKTA